MKTIYTTVIGIILLAGFASCQKATPAQPGYPAVINFNYTGFVVDNNIEMLIGNKVIDELNAKEGFRKSQFIGMENGTQRIAFRKKGSTSILREINLTDAPKEQRLTFFFDGDKVLDKPDFEPANDPNNYGFRMSFNPKSPAVLKEPVDVHIYEWKTRRRPKPVIETYTLLTVVKNVTATLGEHFELPPIVAETGFSKFYVFKIYKAGTTVPPFVPGTDLSGFGPDYEKSYGQLQGFTAGKTIYVMMDVYQYNGKITGFNPQNIGDYF